MIVFSEDVRLKEETGRSDDSFTKEDEEESGSGCGESGVTLSSLCKDDEVEESPDGCRESEDDDDDDEVLARRRRREEREQQENARANDAEHLEERERDAFRRVRAESDKQPEADDPDSDHADQLRQVRRERGRPEPRLAPSRRVAGSAFDV